MKKLVIIAILIPRLILASCDWSTIQESGDTYIYSKECHIAVGKLVKEVELREEQVAELMKTIELKDLAINTQKERIELWRNTSLDLEDRLFKRKDRSTTSTYALIASGVLISVLSAWAMGQANKR
jgi:hypothetical protein